ncbi:hypothetical protein AB0I84_03690 [Streptomyces spectabilis]|uniref:hypothetical protein n=1 Tax=Streptomyces spectabilis TaxID=68270 RepID=UPI00340D8501
MGTAEGGRRLCAACLRRLVADLRSLPRLFDACEQILGGGRSAQPPARTGTTAATGMPFNAAASEVRSALLATLGSWSGLVADERRLPRPRRSAADMADYLERHHDWLGRHPAAGELSEEVSRLVRRAGGVTDPEPQRRIPVGPCVGPGCAGELTAYVHPERPDDAAEIRCSADGGHRWAGEEWTRLGRLMAGRKATTAGAGGRQRVGWLTAADISRLWQLSTGSVYRIASEHGWRRNSRAGRTYYHGGDVATSMRQRRGGTT